MGDNVGSDLLFLLFSSLRQLPSLILRPSRVLLVYPHLTWKRRSTGSHQRNRSPIPDPRWTISPLRSTLRWTSEG